MILKESASTGHPLVLPGLEPSPRYLLYRPLPALASGFERLLARGFGALALRQVRSFAGAERLLPELDPFVLVANHSSRREAVYLAALLLLLRGGEPVHFLADWNFRLFPGVGCLYDASGTITVARKPARPRWLTRFRARYRRLPPALEQARDKLAAGASVGLFPEGRVNRDPGTLLQGHRGAARLSLATGVPVVPIGIRFAARQAGPRIDSNAPMTWLVGAPLQPPPPASKSAQTRQSGLDALAKWHARIMQRLAELSGRTWTPTAAATDCPTADGHVAGYGEPRC